MSRVHVPLVPRWKAVAAGSLAVLFWGASFLWIKESLRELAPFSLLMLCFAVGTVFIWIMAWKTAPDPWAVRLPELWPLAGLGLLGVAVQQSLQTIGLQTASASAASWLAALAPALIMLLA